MSSGYDKYMQKEVFQWVMNILIIIMKNNLLYTCCNIIPILETPFVNSLLL